MSQKSKRMFGMSKSQIMILSILSVFAFCTVAALIGVIFQSWPQSSLSVQPSSPSPQPSSTRSVLPTDSNVQPSNPAVPSSDPNAHHISGDNWYGCSDRAYFEQLTKYIVDQDKQAFEQGLNDGIQYGICTFFQNGESVYLTDSAIFSGLVKVRPQGDTLEFWTNAEAVVK